MTPSELKFHVENRGVDSHFFDRKTMRFFGDTMRNFGVRSATVQRVTKYDSGRPVEFESVAVWELYRKRPVKSGRGSFYFSRVDYSRVFPHQGD